MWPCHPQRTAPGCPGVIFSRCLCGGGGTLLSGGFATFGSSSPVSLSWCLPRVPSQLPGPSPGTPPGAAIVSCSNVYYVITHVAQFSTFQRKSYIVEEGSFQNIPGLKTSFPTSWISRVPSRLSVFISRMDTTVVPPSQGRGGVQY